MKTKEQKRREAYDRLVKHAQMTYKTLLSHEQHNPHAGKQDLVDQAKDASAKVWEFYHKYGYQLPDFKTFHNR